MFHVRKRNGQLEQVNVEKINKCVLRACEGYEDDVSASEIVLDTSRQLFDGIKTEEIDKALVLTTRSKIEKDPSYSKVAARLQINILNKEVFQESTNAKDFERHYREAFVKNLKILAEIDVVNPTLLSDFNLEELSEYIQPVRDDLFKYPGAKTLFDRYVLRDESGRRLETIQAFWMRVAMGLCLNEKDKNGWAKKFYDRMSTFKLCPSTPTLFNSGTTHSQLSSCYVSSVDDDIDGIMGTIHDQARLSKYAGGVGVDFTYVRAKGSKIRKGGKSAGIVPYIKVLCDTLLGFDQKGLRKGSGNVSVEVFHPEIEEFQELITDKGDHRRRTKDLHTSNWIPDLFVERVRTEGEWLLVCPSEAKDLHDSYGQDFDDKYRNYEKLAKDGKLKNFKFVKAKELCRKMLMAIATTGHPWWTFKDLANACYMNKHVGVIHNTQLCTEVFLHTKPTIYEEGEKKDIGLTAVCNLLSLNLMGHIKDNGFDTVEFQISIRTAIRMLDNVPDINYYPTKEAKKSNMLCRPIGLGLMGFADALYSFGYSFEDDNAEIVSNNISEIISYYSIDESINLAIERGVYPQYEGSEWSKGKFHHELWQEEMSRKGRAFRKFENIIHPELWERLREKLLANGIRNGNIIAIAPNATISFIQGCSESIASYYSVLFSNTTLSGGLPIINEFFVNECKKRGLWSVELLEAIKKSEGNLSLLKLPDDIKYRYKSAFEIDKKKYIQVAAARAKWLDQGQSLNIFYDGDSLKETWDILSYIHETGNKSSYYFRTMADSGAEKITVEDKNNNSCSIEAMKRGEVCESCQ